MKSINIILPNKNRDNNGTIKNKILKEIANRYPFFKWHTDEKEPEFSVEYAGPKDILVFGNPNMHLFALNKRFWDNSKYNKDIMEYANTLVEQSNRTYDAETELDIAMFKLKKYAETIKSYEEDKGYDFTYMGMPCRIYDTFIQIGSNIIPYRGYSPLINRIVNQNKRANIIATLTSISKFISVEFAA